MNYLIKQVTKLAFKYYVKKHLIIIINLKIKITKYHFLFIGYWNRLFLYQSNS